MGVTDGIKRLQKRYNLPITGKIDDKTSAYALAEEAANEKNKSGLFDFAGDLIDIPLNSVDHSL